MFVIFLDSTNVWECGNVYGYWRGKHYTVNHELFPFTDDKITEYTKRYKSKKRAENAAEKCFAKFGFVKRYRIEEVDE